MWDISFFSPELLLLNYKCLIGYITCCVMVNTHTIVKWKNMFSYIFHIHVKPLMLIKISWSHFLSNFLEFSFFKSRISKSKSSYFHRIFSLFFISIILLTHYFSFGHCVVCSSLIYRFWLPPFGIFKLFFVNCQILFYIVYFVNLQQLHPIVFYWIRPIIIAH
jgi:hypothetical protein